MCHIAQRNNQKMPKAPLKYNEERLGINEVKQYANKLVHRILGVEGKNGLNQTVLHPIVINTADEVIGIEERMVINGLFNEERTAATKNKNEAYSKMVQWCQTRSAQEQ